MKTKLFLFILVVILTLIYFNEYTHLKQDNKFYHNYYHNTEALLDSLYNWDEVKFQEGYMKTDAYYNYEVSRDNLFNNSLELKSPRN